MAFTSSELTKLAAKVLAAGVVSGENNKQYYEASLANTVSVDDKSVWSQMSDLQDLPANNIAQACQNAFDNNHLIQAYGYNSNGSFNDTTAVRLTPALGSNQHDYIAYYSYNDPQSGRIRNIISPTQIPRSNGLPSAAYQMRLFRGLPSAGNEILTTEGYDGIEVGFFVSAANSLVMFSDADKPANASDPIYAVFFQYVGATGGGSFSGNSILLESPDGNWRIVNDFPHLRFQRRDIDNQGNTTWNSYTNMGASIETDGLTLTRPYDITVNMTDNALNDNTTPDFKSVFRVSGTEDDFTYGNSTQKTILETKKGTDIVRAAALREEIELTNRPLNDLEIVLDNTTSPEAGTAFEYSWVSNLNYTTQTDYIRFNELLFDVVETLDNNGDVVSEVPVRVSVETLNGQLIQENISVSSLNAGINGGFNFKVGKFFYPINPKYSDIRFAKTVTRLIVAKGYRVKLKAGSYTYLDENDNTQNQLVPYQQARVEFLDHAAVLDESNYKDLIHKNSEVILDTGIHTYYDGWSDNTHQLVGVGEHVLANRPVLGNYEAETFIATGSGGLHVLFQDDSTRTVFWTEGDRERLLGNKTPTYFIETKKLEIDLQGIFTSELNERIWDVVNVEKFLPLMRYEGSDLQSYRVSIYSKVLEGHRFQENMTTFDYEDKVISTKHTLRPTLDGVDPEYKEVSLPRKSFSVNKQTPRKIVYEFQEPVKIYGYYKDITDTNDPAGTGTFVPSIKAEVLRIFEEPVVVGSDLEDRVDQIQGEQEWAYATEHNLPTLHIVPSLLWLTDEEGEALLFSDSDNLYTDQDEHQWIFSTGTEAYYEPDIDQGSYDIISKSVDFNPLVVHVPYDTVSGFSVSFAWSDTFRNYPKQLDYGNFSFYIATHGRGMDAVVYINVPTNASVNYQFTRRRDGRYAYRATPYNDKLSSTVTSGGSLTYPEDPNPPIEVGNI
jgi:hypothetical protein